MMAQALEIYIPPRGNLRNAVAWGQNLPMRLHHVIFAYGIFTVQTRAYARS